MHRKPRQFLRVLHFLVDFAHFLQGYLPSVLTEKHKSPESGYLAHHEALDFPQKCSPPHTWPVEGGLPSSERGEHCVSAWASLDQPPFHWPRTLLPV